MRDCPETEKMMTCGAVVLNYNGADYTSDCVDSLLRAARRPDWVIIVDNASTDDSWEKLTAWGRKQTAVPVLIAAGKSVEKPEPGTVVLLQAGENRGYAAGNNIGIRLLLDWGADAVWLLNNDTIVAPEALEALLQRLFSKPRPGLCGARVHYMDTDRVQCCGGGHVSARTALSTLYGYGFSVIRAKAISADVVERNINFIYGASVLASRQFIETVGLMDERYFLYCEEQDWAYSARGRFDLAYAPDAVVWHREGSSTGHSYRKVNIHSLLILTRSRLLLTAKHKPWALPTVGLSIIFAALRMAWRRLVSRPVRF